MFQKKGFTLIELLMVIVILGILAAVAVPKYFDLTVSANQAAEAGVVGGVRAGIMTYFAQNKVYPPSLDSTTGNCTTTNACFSTVLQQGGITSQWTKPSANAYTGPTNTTYTYTPGTGSFQ
jgi:MSHA pilin protein MshA